MATVSIILIFLTILFIYVLRFLKWRSSYWERKMVPHIKPNFLLGNAKSILTYNDSIGSQVLKFTEHFRNQGMKFCGYYFSFRPIFLPIDKDLITKMLITDFEHFTDRPLPHCDWDPLSKHLFALRGSKWKHLRAKLSPAFTKSKSKTMFPIVKACANSILDVLNDSTDRKEVIDTKDLSSRLIMDILSSTIYGLETNSLKSADSDFAYYTKRFLSTTSIKEAISKTLMILYPEILNLFKIKSIPDDITDYFINIVDSTVKYREVNNVIRNDMMHSMLQIKNNIDIVDDAVGEIRKINKQEDSITISEIAAQCFVFTVAGYESSSSAVSFCLYELSLKPEYQERAREDVIEAVRKHEGSITFEALSDMPYLEKCIKETMRKYPILPFLFRSCTKPYQVPNSDVILDKGTTVLISVQSLHYDPDEYPDPEVFDPERFSEGNIAKRHSLSWIPFGSGPRICIAYKFGLMNVKLILASMLMNFKFSLNERTKVPLVFEPRTIQLSTKDAIYLNVEKNTICC